MYRSKYNFEKQNLLRKTDKAANDNSDATRRIKVHS